VVKKPKLEITKKKVLVTAGVVVLLVAAVGAGLLAWWLQSRGNSVVSSSVAPFSKAAESTGPKAAVDAQSLALNGKTDEANKKIQDALNQQGVSDADKYALLVQQGVNYLNDKQNQKALETFQAAEKLQQNADLSQLIGSAEEALGNKDLAIQYYKKALTQLDTNSPGYKMDKQTFEGKVKALGGQL
jgi:tetratricopeptide (TPR) repeat protein